MAGEKNLKRLTSEEARAIGAKGGEKSVKVRREKKAIRELLTDFLYSPCNMDLQKKLAKQAGLNESTEFVEVLTRLAMLNEVKKINLDSLAKLLELTGQANDKPKANNGILDEVTNYFKDKVKEE